MFPDKEQPGGAALNFCANLQRLGEKPTLLSAVGDDPRGTLILEKMRQLNLSRWGTQPVKIGPPESPWYRAPKVENIALLFHAPLPSTDKEMVFFEPYLSMNDYAGLAPAIVVGVEIGEFPPVALTHLLRQGKPVDVMPKWHFRLFDLWLPHFGNRHISKAVGAFRDFSVERVPSACSRASPLKEPRNRENQKGPRSRDRRKRDRSQTICRHTNQRLLLSPFSRSSR